MSQTSWRIGIICSKAQINIDKLMNCGQSFRWKLKVKGETEWIGVIRNHVWCLKQTESGILYRVYGQKPMDFTFIHKKELHAVSQAIHKSKDLFSQSSLSPDEKIELKVKVEENHVDTVTDTSELTTIQNIDYCNKETDLSNYKIVKEEITKEDLHLSKSKLEIKQSKETTLSSDRKQRKRAIQHSQEDQSNIKEEDPVLKVLKKEILHPNKHDTKINEQCIDFESSSSSSSNINRNNCYLPSLSVSSGLISYAQLQALYLKEGINYDLNVEKEEKYSCEDCEQILGDYFQIDVNLSELYSHWSFKDAHFQKVSGRDFVGIRMLRQDPTENLLSFVCSSNNHISRISSMVEKLCIHYGDFIAEVDGEKYYSFPKLSALTGSRVEDHLRELGFGYRAKFIAAIAKRMTEEGKGDEWLESLRQCEYLHAKAELVKLMGVGPKVADCVCLMSLDKTGAVPVDTHVWQITLKHYMAKLQTAKSLTDRIYNEIGDFYRNLWGPYAGWAHSVLFTADLKQNNPKEASSKQNKSVKVTKADKKQQPSPDYDDKINNGNRNRKITFISVDEDQDDKPSVHQTTTNKSKGSGRRKRKTS